jgi:hypothetical protein
MGSVFNQASSICWDKLVANITFWMVDFLVTGFVVWIIP